VPRVGAWLLPLSGAFATAAIGTLLAISTVPGCQTRCLSSFDCGDTAFCFAGRCETECLTNEDCLMPPECEGNPRACVPRGLRCDPTGKCVGRAEDRNPPATGGAGPRVDIERNVDGWEDPPGTGRAFIIDSLTIADRDRGFDIDGKCRGPGDCIDNSLWQLGQLGNDQIRQGLLGGETLLLIELAGVDEPFRGTDRTLSAKFYGARDADDPFFPANNFQIPAGETTCCEFKINPQSIAGLPPQARARSPAKVERGQLRSLQPVPIQFTLTVGVPPHPEIRIEKVYLSARLPGNLGRLTDGLLGGAVPVNTLAQTENPYCKTLNNLCPQQLVDSTLIDLVASILPPDIDLDIPPDGLESLTLEADQNSANNGRVSRCFDGCGTPGCRGREVPPLDPAAPYTCALQPQIADGYSVGITFSGVAASVVGVGQ
jgi:hypothetical protein